MRGMLRRAGIAATVAVAPLAFGVVVSPAVGNAAECGPGTFFDAVTNMCLAAGPPPAPLPPPPPPPLPPVPDLTPGFSVGTCIPIPVPFVPSICGGI